MIALIEGGRRRPLREILQLMIWPLSEEVVSNAQSHLSAPMQLVDYLVVVRIILESTASINRAGNSKTIQLAHKVTRRNQLILVCKHRSFGQRGIKDAGVWPGDEHSSRNAAFVTLYFASGRIWRVLRVADRSNGSRVEHRTIVKMKNKHRSVRCGFVNLFKSWHPSLCELKLSPSADHPHPLRGRRAKRLLLQHSHRISQGRNSIPAQLKVVVKTTTDHMQV